jgi:hypothetical protein
MIENESSFWEGVPAGLFSMIPEEGDQLQKPCHFVTSAFPVLRSPEPAVQFA